MNLEGSNVRNLNWEEIDPATLAGAGDVVTEVRFWQRTWFLGVLFAICIASIGLVWYLNSRLIAYSSAESYLKSFSRDLSTLEAIDAEMQLEFILQERMGIQDWEPTIRKADAGVAFEIGKAWTGVRRAALTPVVDTEGLRATRKSVEVGIRRIESSEETFRTYLALSIYGTGFLLFLSLLFSIGAIKKGGTTLVVQSLGHGSADTPSYIDISASNPLDSEVITKAVNNLPAAIIEFESDGRVLRWNDQMRMTTGISAQDVLGKSVIEILNWAETSEAARSTIRRVFAGETISNLEWQMPHSLGEKLNLSATIRPVIDSGGAVRSAAAVIRDVTAERYSRELMVANDVARLAIIKALPDSLLRFDSDLNLTEIHDNSRVFGANSNDMRGAGWRGLFGEELTRRFMQSAKQAKLTQRSVNFESGFDFNGEWVYLSVRIAVAGSSDLLAVVRDLGDRVRLLEAEERSEARFKSLIEGSADTIMMVSSDGLVLYASPAVKSGLGLDDEGIVGQNWISFVHTDDRVEAEAKWKRILESNETEQFHVGIVNGSGERTVEILVRNLLDDPMVESVIFNIRDVSDRRRLERELTEKLSELERKNESLRSAAQTDPLTGTLNYQALQGYLEAICGYAADSGMFSILMVDIDDFKSFNSDHGFEAGDQLIRTLAESIANSCREEDIFGRSGAEEFLVILPEVDRAETETVLSRIRDQFCAACEGRATFSSSIVTVDSEVVSPAEVLGRLAVRLDTNQNQDAA